MPRKVPCRYGWLFVFSILWSPISSADPAAEFDAWIRSFAAEWQALQLPGLQLAFIENLEQLGDRAQLQQQQRVFRRHQRLLASFEKAAFEGGGLDICRRIDYAIARHEIEMGIQRAGLGLRFIAQPFDLKGARSLADVPLGGAWYRYFLARWNTATVSPDALFSFGKQALRRSVAAYDAIQHEMGFTGDALAFEAMLDRVALRLEPGAALDDLFRVKQAQVWDSLERLFALDFDVRPATIARSSRGAAFPVPGYYERTEQTFYYNLLEPRFEVRQADWLLLHEATPGHHFQLSAVDAKRPCASQLPVPFYAAYLEGWAAYVETLGEELGLYRSAPEKLAAVEWAMVRSARVVLDVGLNAYGWSDQQALAYWHREVRGQRDIAQREIDRMRRWPAQVIAYQYGAAVFERLKRRYVTGDAARADVKAFHRAVLSYGPMPLAHFEALLPELLAMR